MPQQTTHTTPQSTSESTISTESHTEDRTSAAKAERSITTDQPPLAEHAKRSDRKPEPASDTAPAMFAPVPITLPNLFDENNELVAPPVDVNGGTNHKQDYGRTIRLRECSR